ncbi:MAG TPA: hypothetical protein DCE41_14435 [Cytophagales bacterium]|nr:hypothetical protein [Cytophagales bacterium]
MATTQIRVLIQLAMIDGELAEAEQKALHDIAKRHGLSTADIEEIMAENSAQGPELGDLSDDDKFEYMYSLVQLMKVDGRMKEPEIKFVTSLATRLGYDEAVLFELVTKVHNDTSIEMDREVLKRKVQSYLK